jgi:type IV pilus assembly protein PilB
VKSAEPPNNDPGSSETPAQVRESRLGEILVAEGLVSQAEVEEALRVQEALGRYVPLGQVLLERKLVTREQLGSVLRRHRKQLLLGHVLVRSGVLTQDRLQGALSYQRKTGTRLGDAVVALGLASERQLREALCAQLNIAFVDLEHHAPDPALGLDRLVPKTFALRHRLVPIARTGDALTVAMDDPTDTAALKELEALTGHAVHVVTTWRASLDRILRRTYGGVEARPGEGWREPRFGDFLGGPR